MRREERYFGAVMVVGVVAARNLMYEGAGLLCV